MQVAFGKHVVGFWPNYASIYLALREDPQVDARIVAVPQRMDCGFLEEVVLGGMNIYVYDMAIIASSRRSLNVSPPMGRLKTHHGAMDGPGEDEVVDGAPYPFLQ